MLKLILMQRVLLLPLELLHLLLLLKLLDGLHWLIRLMHGLNGRRRHVRFNVLGQRRRWRRQVLRLQMMVSTQLLLNHPPVQCRCAEQW